MATDPGGEAFTPAPLLRHVYKHHPWTRERKQAGPVRLADQLPEGNLVQRFNTRLALKITSGVGTMWCAYAFAAISLYGLPAALKPGGEGIISWIAQTFLQLVLLSIILVGANVLGRAADKQALATYNDGEANLHEVLAAQDHLASQDRLIEDTQAKILAAVGALAAEIAPAPDLLPALQAHIDDALSAAQEKLASSILTVMPAAKGTKGRIPRDIPPGR